MPVSIARIRTALFRGCLPILLGLTFAGAGRGGTIYVSSPDVSTVYGFDTSSTPSAFASVSPSTPTGLAVSSSGTVYAALAGDNLIQAYDPAGALLFSVATGSGGTPYGLALDASGNLLAIEQSPSGNVLGSYAADGTFLGVAATLGGSSPSTLAIDHLQRILYTDAGDGSLRVVGSPTTYTFVGEVAVGVAVGLDGLAYLAMTGDHNGVVRFNIDTLQATVYADTGAFQPSGLAFDPAGKLYVSGFDGDLGNYGIAVFDDSGQYQSTIGTDLINPTYLAFAPAAIVPEVTTIVPALMGLAAGGIFLRRKRS